ncbi:unnamed protein product [Chironomus riparius]|uniref:DM domain-containing protein n=1 Tax=Chironomus riparius TaxID=315576 RepID=A0A9P0JAK7_9DIPT|nr:unnamed protein product [Chironomus riparius]
MPPRRMQLCTFCKKHAIRIGIKNHIRNCPYKTCRCKCCEETRICQRFNRANTKNSRKPVGERTLTLPPELIELLGFEKRILDVMKEIRGFCGRNDTKFGEVMFKWIEKGFEITNRMQMLNPTGHNNNDPNSIQKHSNIPSGLSIEPVMTINGYNGYHQSENCTFISQNGCVDENFYDHINGYEMKSYGYGVEQQMNRGRVPEMILNDASSSPKSEHYPQQDYSQSIAACAPLRCSTINGCHLDELKSFSDNFNVVDTNFKKQLPSSSSSSGSPRLPNFYQTFENK